MNSLYFISLAVFVVMISFVDTTTTTTTAKNIKISGNCQKNLIKKYCSSCGDVCISVDENILDKCTSNINNLLASSEGMDIFESYLRACELHLPAEQLELWRKSIAVLPYNRDYSYNQQKSMGQKQYHLFFYKNGKRVPHLKNQSRYIRVLQNTIHASLTEHYGKFQQKLLSDIKELRNYSKFLCHNNLLMVNKTH